jgi:sulfate adenylyltransferase subunit 1 (EFTu-like GTPase family)
MKKLFLSTIALAALAIAPAYAQTASGTMLSGPGVTCNPSTAASTTGTTSTTSTTASTSAAPSSSTMALSANNQIDAQIARTALTNAQTNVDKLSSLGAASTVCLVDLDTLAQSDTTLKQDISKFQSNNAQIKSSLEVNTALMSTIKTNHPTFDVSKVRAVDIGPNGELVLYVVSGT